MLSSIYIENIAVIEKTTVSFTDGFNVFTGETGAGKSIIIDAINAVLGQRTSKELIRTGTQRAFVQAQFCELKQESIEKLKQEGFEPDEDGNLIIQREIYTNGRNNCKINGIPVNVSTLRTLANALIVIHGQHESYELLSADVPVRYLHSYGGLNDELEKYRESFRRYKELKNELERVSSSESERLRKMDILKYQIDELMAAELEDGEKEELESRKIILQNREKIQESVLTALELLRGNDESNGIISDIRSAGEQLAQASQFQTQLDDLCQRLESAYYELDDISSELTHFEDFEEEGELESIEERLDTIYRLERKYGLDISGIIKKLEDFKQELYETENYEFNIEKLRKEYKTYQNMACERADSLLNKRRQASVRFAEDVRQQLKFLDMPNIKLEFDIGNAALNENACDKVEIMISTNVGEELKSVSKIASGGELSRIMLAIKNVLASNDTLETLIFDEIDTGISGSAAHKVGLKLREISNFKQVICITHQAQIACLADCHYLIEKKVKNDRSYTDVKALDNEERVMELSRIMSGANITQLTLSHAREMLENAKK